MRVARDTTGTFRHWTFDFFRLRSQKEFRTDFLGSRTVTPVRFWPNPTLLLSAQTNTAQVRRRTVALSKGVLHTMLLSKIKAVGVLLVVVLLAAGAGMRSQAGRGDDRQ